MVVRIALKSRYCKNLRQGVACYHPLLTTRIQERFPPHMQRRFYFLDLLSHFENRIFFQNLEPGNTAVWICKPFAIRSRQPYIFRISCGRTRGIKHQILKYLLVNHFLTISLSYHLSYDTIPYHIISFHVILAQNIYHIMGPFCGNGLDCTQGIDAVSD